MYFCRQLDYYKKFVRTNIISKHNILNQFEILPFKQINVFFSLKKINRECVLLLFWLSFILIGKKPLFLKIFSGYKKKKIKFIVTLKFKDFVKITKTLAIFIFSNQENKNRLQLKSETSGFFFFFDKTYLEYMETFRFYDFLSSNNLTFLLENIFLIFKFYSKQTKLLLKTFLNSYQIPV
jgi:hypothetical protein